MFRRDSNRKEKRYPQFHSMNVLRWLFLCVIVFTMLGGLAMADSGKITNPDNNHSYQRIETRQTWDRAKATCETLGAHLATVTSASENQFLLDNLCSTGNIGDYRCWLGATDAGSEGTWKWVNGETWSFIDWGSGEPNNQGEIEHCLVYKNNKWNDTECTSDYYPLCEWEPTPCVIGDEAGRNTPETFYYDMGSNAGTFTFQYDTRTAKDDIVVSYEGQTLYNTDCVGTEGWKSVDLSFSGSSSEIKVVVTPNCVGNQPGTLWYFKITSATCPIKRPTLTVTKSGTGSGTVTSSPSGINCGSTCSAGFAKDTSVTLTAAADSGSTFTGWSGDCSGTSATCTVTMSAARSVTATFTGGGTQKYTLTVTKSGSGTGVVTTSTGSLTWNGNTGTATYDPGTPVTLSANANSGSTFTGWTGCDSISGNQCTVTMSAAKNVTATFTGNTATCSVTVGSLVVKSATCSESALGKHTMSNSITIANSSSSNTPVLKVDSGSVIVDASSKTLKSSGKEMLYASFGSVSLGQGFDFDVSGNELTNRGDALDVPSDSKLTEKIYRIQTYLNKITIKTDSAEVEGKFSLIDHFSDAFEILGSGAGSIGYSASISQSTGIKITGMEFEGGKIGLKGTPIVLKDLVLSFSSDTLTAGGGFEIKRIKTGINGGAFSLTIKSGSIEALTLEVDGNVPIGSVFFINELEGGAEGFKTPPVKVHLRGLFSGGPDIGGFKFVCLDVEGKLSFDSVLSGSASGGLLCFDEGNDQGLISKNGAIGAIAEASIDWKTPSLTANGKLNFPFDVLKGNAKFALDSQSINGNGVFDICAPDVVPYIGGKCAAQTKAILNMKGAGGEIAVWGDWLHLAYAVEWKIAQAKSLKDTANYIHVGTNLDTLGVKQQSAFRYVERGLQSRAITTISVPGGLSVVLIRLDWQTGSTDFNVTMPDGTKITPANAANSQTYVYQKLSNEAWYAIKNPPGGTYTIEIGDDTSAANDVRSIGTYQLSYHSLTNPSTIKVTSPATLTTASTSVNIQYDAHDSDDTAKISLFYSKDNTSANGILIVDNLVEQDGSGSYTWDVSNVPNGTYYVYALIDDGKNAPVVSYSAGAVKVSHGTTTATPANLKATVTGNQVDLSWTGVSKVAGYIIHYTDDVKQLTYKDRIAVASNATSYSMKNLKSNTTYRITITSFDDNLIEGDEATPVTAYIAAVATPTIVLSTDTIDFGTTVAGTTYTKKFTISNTGSAALTISEMFTLGTNSSVLTLNPSSLPMQIQSNASAEITVTMVAPSTQLSASIVINSNDPINPSMQISATTVSTQSTTYALTVTKTGSGTVTASTGTLTWSDNTGTTTYSSGTSVTLTATPTQDSKFGGWTGCDSTSGNQCTVTMSSNRGVSVSFTQGVCLLCRIPRMDFNGNGKSDILWRNMSNGIVYTWLMNGINIASGGSLATLGDEWQIESMGDFNGDDNTDIVWRNTSTGMVYIWLMGGATVANSGSPATLGHEWQIESIGDFNGDGRSDIMWRNTSTGMVYTWFMNGANIAGGASPSSLSQPSAVDSAWQVVSSGDFDGDDTSDVLWINTSTGMTYIWFMNGKAGGSPGTVGTQWQIACVSDFNGDDTTDILWRNISTGMVYIWLMNGATIAGSGSPATVGLEWQIVNVGDFNGDGKSDLLWRNTENDMVYTWLMNGTTITGGDLTAKAGTQWQIISVGDFNGDGKRDIVWRNTATGEICIWLMDGTQLSLGGLPAVLGTEWQIQ